jgi:DNA polymerase-3 subunit delta'
MKPHPWHVEALEKLLAARERLPHAVLVHGPAGIGKVQFARSLAAAMLCETPGASLACGACSSCHWFSQGNHPDFREILPEAAAEDEEDEGEATDGARADKAKSLVIKIEQIRAVGDFVALSTHRAGYRVLVLHPAEALQPASANALLKTLEEPPPRTLIAMVSSRPQRLLPTLRSRCRLLALRAPARADALAWLRAEGVAGPEAAIAAAGGAPLLARDLAGPEEAELRRRVVSELARPGGADAVQFAAGVTRATLERTIWWMQTWVHDLLRARLAGDVRHHAGELQALRARARTADLEALFGLDRELAEARRLASHPLNPRLLSEHLLMAYNRATAGQKP